MRRMLHQFMKRISRKLPHILTDADTQGIPNEAFRDDVDEVEMPLDVAPDDGMGRILTIAPEILKMVRRSEAKVVGQCLNFSVHRSSWLEKVMADEFPAGTFTSEIAIGNFRMGPDRDLCYDEAMVQVFAKNPLKAIQAPLAQFHAWNVVNGIIIDMTLLYSLKSQGAPIKAEPAYSGALITQEYGFHLEWVPHEIYPAAQLRQLMGV